MSVTYDRFRLTLTGAASYGYGKKTFRRGVPVETSDTRLIDWAQKSGRFTVEPVLDADQAQADAGAPHADPEAKEWNVEHGRIVEKDVPAPPEKSETAEGDDQPPAEPTEPDPDTGAARSWIDDVLKDLLGMSVREIGPKLEQMTPADLQKLRELEVARGDTRKTLLEEIDQELRKKG